MAPSAADPLVALASPRRREIVRMVWSEERSAGEIARAFDVSWPAISQNLRVLKVAGLVKERRAGTSRLYRADLTSNGWTELAPGTAQDFSVYEKVKDGVTLSAVVQKQGFWVEVDMSVPGLHAGESGFG